MPNHTPPPPPPARQSQPYASGQQSYSGGHGGQYDRADDGGRDADRYYQRAYPPREYDGHYGGPEQAARHAPPPRQQYSSQQHGTDRWGEDPRGPGRGEGYRPAPHEEYRREEHYAPSGSHAAHYSRDRGDHNQQQNQHQQNQQQQQRYRQGGDPYYSDDYHRAQRQDPPTDQRRDYHDPRRESNPNNSNRGEYDYYDGRKRGRSPPRGNSGVGAERGPHSQSYRRDGGGAPRQGGSGPPPQASSAAPIPIPPSAPRLIVPTDLSVEVTSFLDLIAHYVVQGGPTLEEELSAREEHNPAFAFLNASYDHPHMLYYRWRLYSLLQGDDMLRWRTSPFQIENHPKAFVFVPPPALPSGPDTLLNAFAKNPGASATLPTAYPLPSESWLSRLVVREGRVFVTLPAADMTQWATLLDYKRLLGEDVSRRVLGSGEQSASSTNAATSSYEAVMQGASEALFHSEVVAERMIFVIDHATAVQHVLSFLLDEVIKIAYDAASLSSAPASTTDAALCEKRMGLYGLATLWYLFILHDVVQNAAAVPMTEADVLQADEQERVGSKGAVGVPGTEAKDMPTGAALLASLARGNSNTPSSATHTLTASERRARGNVMPAVEAIAPTLLEACLLVSTAMLQYASPDARSSSVLDRGGLRVEAENAQTVATCLSHISTTIVPPTHPGDVTGAGSQQSSYLRVSFTPQSPPHGADSNQVVVAARLLLAWVRQFLSWWTSRMPEPPILPDMNGVPNASPSNGGEELVDRTIFSNLLRGRVATTLAEKYGFLLNASHV